MHDIAFIFAGFFVGIVVGLTGVGGGSLMTPILIFIFGVKPYMAVGTDLLFAAFTKLGGTVKTARSGLVDWRVVLHLSAGSIPAALITLWVLKTLGPADAAVQNLMTSTLGVALLLTAAATLYKALRGKISPQHITRGQEKLATTPRHWSLPLLFGALIGTLVSLTSVGAGRHWCHGVDAALPHVAAAAHCGRRHRLRRAADPGGGCWSCHAGVGGLADVEPAAGGFTARHLARRALHDPHA